MDRQKEDSYQIVNYYKRNRTIDMLLMEEFAFSLLFNNIAPDKLQVALDSVGLNRIPSLFLLIQVDDHLNESKRLNTENEFVLKVRIADIIRTCFERNGLEPVVANLTGTDKLVAFLVILYKLIPNIFTEICFKKSLDDTGFILICYYKIIYIRNSISVDSGSNTFFVKKCLNFLNTLGQVGNGFGIQFNFYTVTCV